MSNKEALTAFASLPLPVRMRAASKVLVDAAYRFTGCSNAEDRQMRRNNWNADQLDYWAGRWECEDEAHAATEELAEQIAVERWGVALKHVASDYRDDALLVAGIAIRAGYRKVSDDEGDRHD